MRALLASERRRGIIASLMFGSMDGKTDRESTAVQEEIASLQSSESMCSATWRCALEKHDDQ